MGHDFVAEVADNDAIKNSSVDEEVAVVVNVAAAAVADVARSTWKSASIWKIVFCAALDFCFVRALDFCFVRLFVAAGIFGVNLIYLYFYSDAFFCCLLSEMLSM
jgi:hypothetical protein